MLLTIPILANQRAVSTLEVFQHLRLKLQWSKSVPALLTFITFVTPCWKAIATTICTNEISLEVPMIFHHLCTPMALIQHFPTFWASMRVGTQSRSPRSLEDYFDHHSTQSTDTESGTETKSSIKQNPEPKLKTHKLNPNETCKFLLWGRNGIRVRNQIQYNQIRDRN